MRKAMLILLALTGLIAIGAIARRRAGGCTCPPGQCECGARKRGTEGRARRDIWARMEEKMAEMPETFPPRVMFDNIAVIREQNDRILELLKKDATPPSADGDESEEASA